jgi:mannose-1-phosphate guanylyltransferase / mannose-6-phosphate isomerase
MNRFRHGRALSTRIVSLQKHRHRAEHWVVRGTAEVTIGEQARAVHENESVYISIGSVHRMANKEISLELIEVQTTATSREDDIERRENVYKRS